MADSDLELDGGGEGGEGVVLLAVPAFPPFVISFFFQSKIRGTVPGHPLDSPL